MFSNMVASLIDRGRIQTTEAKAKELRRIADRVINWGVTLGDLLSADKDKLTIEQKAQIVHHMRMARRVLKDRKILLKLFGDVAPKMVGRPGGYTRLIKLARPRRGDGAPLAIVELVSGSTKVEAEAQ